MSNHKIDLNSLRLKYNAEFDDWQDFVSAVEEFQRETNIKLTITTSKRISAAERAKKKAKGLVISVVDEDSSKERFEYKYLKLTCKHYGGYRSTSRGIRPNQKTVKLMCPTYIYGSFDHYKDRFCIKQMVVNCNHELKDEEVLLPKLLKERCGPGAPKKYVRKRNRNVLKVPLESPASGTLIVSLKSKIRCNHDSNAICEAYSFTSNDLSSIISLFSTKTREEQNQLILQWIEVSPFKKEENDDGEDKIQVQFRLPTIDDTLIKVCSKSFLSILNINMSRVDYVISAHYTGKLNFPQERNTLKDNQEVETSIATILTSLSREEPASQVLYIDHVDVPSAEDTIEDSFAVEHPRTLTDEEISEVVITTDASPEECVKLEAGTPGLNMYIGSIPWSRRENDPWASDVDHQTVFYKVDDGRNIAVVSVHCGSDCFVLKVYNQVVNCERLPMLSNLQKQYAGKQIAHNKLLLDRLNSLMLCMGIRDPRIKHPHESRNSLPQEAMYCFYSDSIRSRNCSLLFGDDWSLSMCPECAHISEILKSKLN